MEPRPEAEAELGPVCPRCEGYIPNNEKPGAYPGALSRVANIEICSACGEDEGIRDWLKEERIQPEDWPTERKYSARDLYEVASKKNQRERE